MLTETVRQVLSEDGDLLDLLGVDSGDVAPIRAGYLITDIPPQVIVIEMVFGRTEQLGYEAGEIRIEIYVKEKHISEPLAQVKALVERINEILDLKGSQLNDEYTQTIYRLRKTGTTFSYDQDMHAHVASIDYEFYCTR